MKKLILLSLIASGLFVLPAVSADLQMVKKSKLEVCTNYEAFFEAVKSGDVERVNEIINSDTNVDLTDEDGLTPLMWASWKGYPAIVYLLLQKGAQVDFELPVDVELDEDDGEIDMGETALMIAARKGHLDVVTYLIEKGANVNHSSSCGHTALMNAARKGHLEVVSYLIKKGANVNHQENNKQTALMWAGQGVHVEVITLLLLHGANQDIKDNDNVSAFTWVEYAHEEREYQRALDLVTEELAKDSEGVLVSKSLLGQLLMKSSERGRLKDVMFLIEKGAQVDVELDEDDGEIDMGETALMIAARKGHLDVVTYLIEKGANVNHASSCGHTALMNAAQKGHLGLVAYLIKKGANVNHQENNDQTALMWAAEGGHRKVITLLLLHGANQDIKDSDDTTALDWAKRCHKEGEYQQAVSCMYKRLVLAGHIKNESSPFYKENFPKDMIKVIVKYL